jgi:hypothetical protein
VSRTDTAPPTRLGQRRTRPAGGAAGALVGAAHAGSPQRRRDPPGDVEDKARVRRTDAVPDRQRPGQRAERDDERVDPHADQPFGARDQLVRVLTETGQQVGGHPVPAEHPDGFGPGAFVVGQRDGRLAGRPASPHGVVQGLDVDADGGGPGRAQVADRGEVARRLALHLHRQARHGGDDGADAVGEQPGAAVRRRGAAGRHHHLAHPVKPDGRLGDLGELLGCLQPGGGTRPQRLLDRAEPAAVPFGVADAGLQDGGG